MNEKSKPKPKPEPGEEPISRRPGFLQGLVAVIGVILIVVIVVILSLWMFGGDEGATETSALLLGMML